MYARKHYPKYLNGGFYIIPFVNVDCLYMACLELPYYFINDVFVTGFAAKACHLSRENLDGMIRFGKAILQGITVTSYM